MYLNFNTEKLKDTLEGIRTIIQIIFGIYIIFCVIMYFYYIITLHEVPDNCSFFSLSANIGFMILVVILMLAIICS
jgi:hypothetical protein